MKRLLWPIIIAILASTWIVLSAALYWQIGQYRWPAFPYQLEEGNR